MAAQLPILTGVHPRGPCEQPKMESVKAGVLRVLRTVLSSDSSAFLYPIRVQLPRANIAV